jgi:peptide/nickel transport system substrate-binding protein
MNDFEDQGPVKQTAPTPVTTAVSRRMFLKLTGIAGAAAMLGGGLGGILAACGESATTTTGAAATTTGAGPATTAGGGATTTAAAVGSTTLAAEAKYGGILKQLEPLSHGDPCGWPAAVSMSALGQEGFVAEGLYRLDAEGKVVPWLAETVTLSDDHKSMTFKLRQGVKFTDGTDLTAEVTKWNLDNCIAEKSIADLVSVDIVDENTIRANFDKWSNRLWITMSADNWHASMVSKAAYDQNGGVNGGKDWMTWHPTGTGPFKFSNFELDTGAKYEKNPNYWRTDVQGAKLPYLDGLEVVIMPDPMTGKAKMQAKETDFTACTVGKLAKDLEGMGCTLYAAVSTSLCLIADTAHADSPFSKKPVREAVEYALDREAIADAFSYGYWPAAYQVAGPATNCYNPNFTLGRKRDLDRAKQLLSEAGYADGFKATLTIFPADFDPNIWVAVQGQLAEIGIKLDLATFTTVPAWFEGTASLTSVLAASPLQDRLTNFTMAMADVVSPPMNPNWKWTEEFTQLVAASFDTAEVDVSRVRAVSDYLVQEALFTPLIYHTKAFAAYPYLKNGGFLGRSFAGVWKPEQAWLDK